MVALGQWFEYAWTEETVVDLAKLKNAASRVFGPTPIFLAYAYGSRVRGRPRPDSDLDSGVCLPRDTPSLGLFGLAADLGQEVGCEVDMYDLREAPLEFRGTVLETGVRIYWSDNDARVDLERNTLSRYHDDKEELDRMHRLRLRLRAKGVTPNE